MTKLKIDTPAFDTLEPMPEHKAAVFEYFAGTGEFTDACYSARGFLVSGHEHLVAVQTSPVNGYELALRVGDRWHSFATVPRDDTVIQQHIDAGLVVEAPESPGQKERHERKAREERGRQASAQARAEAGRLRGLRRLARGLLKQVRGRDLDDQAAERLARNAGFDSVEDAERHA